MNDLFNLAFTQNRYKQNVQQHDLFKTPLILNKAFNFKERTICIVIKFYFS